MSSPEPSPPVSPAAEPDAQTSDGVPRETSITSEISGSYTNDRSLGVRVKRALFGNPRDIHDSRVFHHISLIPFLAWVGLGADGLSSSAYGPEEAFKNLQSHTYLAVALAAVMGLTVFIISAAYRGIIEEFPHGGGGYVVATKLLGKAAGVISGSALLVDYILTITVSIAAAGDAIFSFLPPGWVGLKMPMEIFFIAALTTLNLRGAKESAIALVPVFILFCVTHLRSSWAASWRTSPSCRPPRAPSAPGFTAASRRWAWAGCCCSSCTPTRSAAARTPGSRRSRTACRSCASRASRRPSGPWSTWRPRWRSPPRACCSATCSGTSPPSRGRR